MSLGQREHSLDGIASGIVVLIRNRDDYGNVDELEVNTQARGRLGPDAGVLAFRRRFVTSFQREPREMDACHCLVGGTRTRTGVGDNSANERNHSERPSR